MQTIHLSLVIHNNQQRINLQFDYDSKLNGAVQRVAGSRWSKTDKCWHIPYGPGPLKRLEDVTAGMAILDTNILKQQMLELKTTKPEKTTLSKPGADTATASKQIKFVYRPVTAISENNQQQLANFLSKLQLKAYSPSTIRTYKNEFGAFLQTIKQRNATDISADDLKRYLLYCLKDLKLTENTIHSRLNALKFYFEQVLGHEKFFFEIPRPKKPIKLPKVISEEKILKGLLSLPNLKHKTILLLAYSAGLRVSEVTHLKLGDVDSDRMQLRIDRAKGKKDRVVTLSSSLLPILREYYLQYKPKTWLFEGQFGEQYSERSAQEIFHQAFKKLNLPAQCSFHSLRHSYATHLLESGTDISYIQKLLGHNDIKTTLRYAQVSKKDIGNVESPLDKAIRKKGG